MENAMMPGLEQEDLTQEEKEVVHHKTLTTANPQAPHNITKFSYKDRAVKTDDVVEHMVFHYSVDGDALLVDCDEARDQEEYHDNKKRTDQELLDAMNQAIIKELGKDPRKSLFSF